MEGNIQGVQSGRSQACNSFSIFLSTSKYLYILLPVFMLLTIYLVDSFQLDFKESR